MYTCTSNGNHRHIIHIVHAHMKRTVMGTDRVVANVKCRGADGPSLSQSATLCFHGPAKRVSYLWGISAVTYKTHTRTRFASCGAESAWQMSFPHKLTNPLSSTSVMQSITCFKGWLFSAIHTQGQLHCTATPPSKPVTFKL